MDLQSTPWPLWYPDLSLPIDCFYKMMMFYEGVGLLWIASF